MNKKIHKKIINSISPRKKKTAINQHNHLILKEFNFNKN